MIYKGFIVEPFTNLKKDSLKEVYVDQINWRIYYKNDESNWIKFYPFSEYHGGGEAFTVKIGETEFNEWINRYEKFESEIRELIIETRG